MGSDVYKVQTEFFEGPLDLLLHLIRKNKMNILDVKISDITSEYLFYLKNKRGINPSREGDFLITASTLIYIKSRSLLPRSDVVMEESPEKELIDTLVEYDKIQKISKKLTLASNPKSPSKNYCNKTGINDIGVNMFAKI